MFWMQEDLQDEFNNVYSVENLLDSEGSEELDAAWR